jgi:hypothetical protein
MFSTQKQTTLHKHQGQSETTAFFATECDPGVIIIPRKVIA